VTISGSGFGAVQGTLSLAAANIAGDAALSEIQWWSDNLIVITVTTLSGPDTITVSVTGGADIGFATGFQPQNGQATNGVGVKRVPLAATGAPTLQVTCNGQTVTANSSTCFISADPAFPQLVASLTPATNVQWTFTAVYDSPPYQVKNDPSWYYWEYTCSASGSGSSWNVANTGGICGGSATISYTGSYNGSITFNILGYNPTVSAVQTALSAYPWMPSQPWYLFQLVNQESSYYQFCPAPPLKATNCTAARSNWPHWGPPEGFGLTQVDLTQNPPSVYQSVIWDWTQSVTLGSRILQHDIANASSSWAQSLLDYSSYVNGTLTNGVVPPYLAPPSDVLEGGPPGGGCLFSYNYPAKEGTHPYSDAIAMKYYNAGAGSPYEQFVGPTSATAFDGHWAFSPYGGNGTDYVNAVCTATPGN
jgi:hypothetical protein